jgi:hypothetical protein
MLNRLKKGNIVEIILSNMVSGWAKVVESVCRIFGIDLRLWKTSEIGFPGRTGIWHRRRNIGGLKWTSRSIIGAATR